MNPIGSTQSSETHSATLSTFDDRAVPLAFTVSRMPIDPLPRHRLEIVDVNATPHGFRVHYRIDPVILDGWAPWADATDEDGTYWLFGGGGYGVVEEASPPYTDGVVTTGPACPQPGMRYRVVMGLHDDRELQLEVWTDAQVAW